MHTRLPFKGTSNTRDLGGYVTDYGTIKFGRLIRSDNLKYITEEDFQIFEQYNIKTIIDLRHQKECLEDQSIVPEGVNIIHIPLVIDVEKATSYDYYLNTSLSIIYSEMLASAKEPIKKILETIMIQDESLLYHCTFGKDRTGIISMLLLGLLGVSDQDIVTNYEVSYANLLFRKDIRNWQVENKKVLLQSQADDMIETLNAFYKTYQSFSNYAKEIGIDQTLIKTFMKKNIRFI